jgi:hypothetical protein
VSERSGAAAWASAEAAKAADAGGLLEEDMERMGDNREKSVDPLNLLEIVL